MKPFFLLFIIIRISSFGQIQEKYNLSYKQFLYDAVIVKIDSTSATSFTILENNNLTNPLLQSQKSNNYTHVFFTVAPTDISGNLLGLYIAQQKEKQELNLGKGTGNFFLKPNGIWGLRNYKLEIIRSESYLTSNRYQFAVQSGPMLLLNGVINPIFDPQSQNRNIRVCMGLLEENDETYMILTRSLQPVSFYDVSLLFKDYFKCKQAIYLDGGDCALLLLPSQSIIGCDTHITSKIGVIKY